MYLVVDMKHNQKEVKTCKKCKATKSLEEFSYNKSKGRREARCKRCRSEQSSEYYKKNREAKLAYASDPERVKRAATRHKIRYKTDEQYRERIKAKDRARRKTAKYKATRRGYSKRKWAECINHRLRSTIHKSMRRSLFRTSQKSRSIKELAGCTVAQLRSHFESLWREGMNWNNHGIGEGCWQIDHIRPISSFDLNDLDQRKACFHWSNLQPLWQVDNLRKRGIPYDQLPLDLLPVRDSCLSSSEVKIK